MARSWTHKGRRARLELVIGGCSEDVIVVPEPPHSFGDPRYCKYDFSEERGGDGRAAAFRLVCSPPPPPHRAQGFAGEELRRTRSQVLAEVDLGIEVVAADVALFHPVVEVRSLHLVEGPPIEWCRLESRHVRNAEPRWIDVVSARAFPAWRAATNRHYARFYERLGATRA